MKTAQTLNEKAVKIRKLQKTQPKGIEGVEKVFKTALAIDLIELPVYQKRN